MSLENCGVFKFPKMNPYFGLAIPLLHAYATPRYLFAVRDCPAYLRSDNGPEFISKVVKKWLGKSGVEKL